MNERRIKRELKEKLSEYRYLHSLHTAVLAKKLASHYGEDEKKAYLCGLVHDMAKEFDKEEMEEFLKDHHLDLKLLKGKKEKTAHALIGSILAKEKYQFTDDMCNAILYHTTGRENMTKLEKIIYLADKIELGKNYPFIEEERKIAFENLDQAVLLCLKNKMNKKMKEEKEIPLDIQKTFYSLTSSMMITEKL